MPVKRISSHCHGNASLQVFIPAPTSGGVRIKVGEMSGDLHGPRLCEQQAATVGVVGGSGRSGFAMCCGSQNRDPLGNSPIFNHTPSGGQVQCRVATLPSAG